MQNLSAIRPAARRPFQENSWWGCPPPLHWQGLRYPKKTEHVAWSYIPTTSIQHFKQIYPFLAVQWPKSQENMMTSPFETRFFGISDCRTSNQMTILEYWDKIGQEKYNFKENSVFEVKRFWPELDLTLSQIWKYVSPSNSSSQMTRKTCVTRYSCYFLCRDLFDPTLTLSYTDHLPRTYMASLRSLQYHFGSVLACSWLWSGLGSR